MSLRQCPRLFEAESMRDGRLTGADGSSFERHVALCSACSREVRALEALADSLRASPRHDALDELHVRRERTRLLAAFDAALVAPKRRSARPWSVFPAAAAVVGVVVLFLWHSRVLPSAPMPAAAVIRAESDALWSSQMEGNRERVVLVRGALWIHVDHASGEGRLVVELPDGELDDTGTTFTVSADADRTTAVVVDEGRVLLRLHGRPPVTIGPGDTWVPDAPAPMACVAAPAPTPAVSAQGAPTEPSSQPPRTSLPPARTAPRLDASIEFRRAMEALARGDNGDAAALFAAFLSKHPRDRQAEDAAYLRVIALQRWGDAAAAKDGAREYLRRYPSGFRRVEMDQLSR